MATQVTDQDGTFTFGAEPRSGAGPAGIPATEHLIGGTGSYVARRNDQKLLLKKYKPYLYFQ
jgi:hypothetical protein